MREGTLSQLKVKVGDKVRPIKNPHGGDIRSGRLQVISKADPYYGWYEGYTMDKAHRDDHRLGEEIIFRLEEQAMKTWEDMNCKEQCELKEAYRTGKTIQFFSLSEKDWVDCGRAGPAWLDGYSYRVEPETKEEAVKLWKDMTACEKGTLLLAYHHEGKTIEYRHQGADSWLGSHKVGLGVTGLGWHDNYYYRVKREPVVTEVVRYGVADADANYCGGFLYANTKTYQHTHKITFNLVDGVPDCNSIKMVKL